MLCNGLIVAVTIVATARTIITGMIVTIIMSIGTKGPIAITNGARAIFSKRVRVMGDFVEELILSESLRSLNPGSNSR
jgi:hypothetical protein